MRPKQWHIPDGGIEDVVARVGDVLFVRTGNRTLVSIDVSSVPPKIAKAPVRFPLWLAPYGRKRWLVLHHRSAPMPLTLTDTSDPMKPGKDAVPRSPGRRIREVALVDGDVYVQDIDVHPPRLLRVQGGALVEVAGVPPGKEPTCGKAVTGDGDEILIWNGDGYEKRGDKLVKTFALAAKAHGEWNAVPAGHGFYFTSSRRVLVAERGKKPRALHPRATKVMHLSEGPDGALLCVFGSNPKRWQVGVFHNGAMATFTNGDLGTQRDTIMKGYWSARARHVFLVAVDADLVAIPAATFGW